MKPELRLILFASAGSLFYKEAGELAVKGFSDIHFRALVKNVGVLDSILGSTNPERIANHYGVHLRQACLFLGGSERANEEQRNNYVCV